MEVERAAGTGTPLELVLRGVAEAITVQDHDGRLVFANDAAAQMLGFDSPEELLAASPVERLSAFEVLDDSGAPLPLDRLPGRRALAGETGGAQTIRYRVRATGEERWSIVRAAPIEGADGTVELAINTFHDITGRVLAERRLAFLAEASERLGAASLDWEETLKELAEIAIPALADWCIVDVLEDDGKTLREVTVAAADPRNEQLLREMRERYRPAVDSPQPAARALLTGETQVYSEFTPELLRETTRDEHHFSLISRLNPSAAIAVPLKARGHIVGVATFAWSESKRGYTEADIELAQELARRAGLAVENARLYRAEQEAGARVTFLAEAGRVLGSSLDFETTLRRVARLVVERLADWCAIDLLDDAGQIRRLTVAHRDPSKAALGADLPDRLPPDSVETYGAPNVLRTGRSELHAEIAGERSLMCVPLIARGRVLGAITFASDGRRRFTREDLGEAEELARRAAIAVDNARLFHEAERRADAARVLAYIGDGVFLLDADGIVRLWNRAAETITGLTASQVVGRRVAEALPGWAAIADRVPIAAAPGAGTAAETLPLELPTQELWLSISGVGFLEGTVFAFRDLTEERAIERLKSDFVSTVSHELRTPLAAIYGAALTLRRGDLMLDELQRENLLAVVANEADRLARTVNDILWTSRLDTDTLRVAIESCDAGMLAADVVAAAETHLPESIELDLTSPPDVPRVAADPDKVRQVLANLVENAVKYSPDGGRVYVAVESADGNVRFSVTDQGLGIPPTEQRRIFDKFYRLDPEMTRGVGGTGLGLYICRELVRRMDGRIWVDSREGGGSTFAFELPAASS
ncbi:MAG TPA: ATP-binding protein [Gaiellaceae bacterium]|nr:ATP-binding protein [Gaiellaceae bacterium]